MQTNSLSHSMLEFFGKIPILDPNLLSKKQQMFPTNSLNLTCDLLDYSLEEGLLKEIEHIKTMLKKHNW